MNQDKFLNLFKEADLEYERDSIIMFFFGLEQDATGCIDINQFVKLMESGGELDEKLMITNIFTNFDSDKDGFIEFIEFEKLGKTVAIFDSNPDDLIEAFNAADANKDGKISLDEFIKVLQD